MDELLSLAVDIHHAFGPEMRIAPVERLKKARPELDPAQADQLAARAASICGEAYALAERSWHGELSQDEGRRQLGEMFAMLSEPTLDALWMKGGYFAWHG